MSLLTYLLVTWSSLLKRQLEIDMKEKTTYNHTTEIYIIMTAIIPNNSIVPTMCQTLI